MDQSAVFARALSGDSSKAQACASLTVNRAQPATGPLAALGTALRSCDATGVQKAAQTLQEARTGRTSPHRNADAAWRQAASTTAVHLEV